MGMVLTQPSIRAMAWGTAINANFQTIQDFCNALGAMAVVDKTSSYPLVQGDAGSTFTNYGAGGSVTFTLPATPTGLYRVKFRRIASQAVVISGGTIKYGDAAGTSITLDSDYSEVVLEYHAGSNLWFVQSATGSNSGLT